MIAGESSSAVLSLSTTRRSLLLGAAATLAASRAGRSDAQPAAAATPAGPIRLSANENPYGPSPRARAAIIASVNEACRYAFASAERLKRELAAEHGVAPEQLLLGAGSGELLHMAALTYLRQGGELVAPGTTFEQLPSYANKLGALIRRVPLTSSLALDLEAMRSTVTAATGLVYLCNPNNPTGTALTATQLADFIRQVPASVPVLVDEAYIELADAPGVTTVAPLVAERPNVFILRTFSKLHGLAGMRIGYAFGSRATIDALRPWQMTSPSVPGIDAALASLQDRDWLADCRRRLIADRTRMVAAVRALGRPVADTQGNFLFMDTGMPVATFRERMAARNLQVGRLVATHPTWCRVTVGTSAEVDAFLEALPAVLAG